ncbi:MAG TPA: metallophosphoesterase [Tepidisphaeraceae bacterium]|jgi:hypothetical protein|nr:metallophosphoesterase [Tepidisphaeraceae bacterium]
MSRFLLLLAVMIAGDVIFWRVSDRRLQRLRLSRLWRLSVGGFMLVQLSYIVSIFVGSIIGHVPNFRPMIWPIAVYVWHLSILPIAILELAISRTGAASNRLLQRLAARTSMLNEPSASHSISRRQALAGAAAMVPPLAAIGIAGRSTFEIEHFRIRRVELHLPTLPSDLDGVTIAHVADLHIGKFLPSGMAERVAEATNALEADVVAFAGDLLDISGPRVTDGIDFIRRLHSRSGLVMIEGNHDVMVDVDRFEGEVLSAGLPLLRDETKTFNVSGRKTPIQFLGISWGPFYNGADIGRSGKEANRRFRMPSDVARAASVKAVVGQRQPNAFPILLAHHPHAFDHATEADLPLTLSGHTHGGQIMLTKRIGAGPLRYKYWTGLYKNANSQLFVSNGIGNWFPLRINSPAEIVHITLRTGNLA